MRSWALLFFAFATQVAFGFNIGADMGWISQFEREGKVVCDSEGRRCDPFELMKRYGVDSVRLRVWVNPKGGWNGKDDVVAKAKRARQAGMELMIDFHYSDDWADPGKQPTPAAWLGKTPEQIAVLLAAHTREVLTALKDVGIAPRWVQVGNETTNGMLWRPKLDKDGKMHYVEKKKCVWVPEMVDDIGSSHFHGDNYARFFKAGYAAVKEVFPESIVIVHLTPANNLVELEDNLNVLAKHGAKWDMIGLSLYPYHSRPGEVRKDVRKIPDFDSKAIADGIANSITLAKKWKTPTMIVETGFETVPTPPLTLEYSRTMMERVVREAREHTQGKCLGVFYWEPICPEKLYPLGAFLLKNGNELYPTIIMDAFKAGYDNFEKPKGLPKAGICAHQGDTCNFPGNTVEAFQSAVGKGAAMIEFDLKRCKSGEIVLNHDYTVTRNGKKEKVIDLTLAELKAIDLRGCRIPTLQEGLKVISKDGVWINVHTWNRPEDAGLAVEAMEFLKRDGRIHQAFLSTPAEILAEARAKVPETIGNSMNYPNNCWHHMWSRAEIKEHFEIAEKNNCKFVQPHMAMLSAEDTAEFRMQGGLVNYYVCNTPLRLEPMLDGGVNFPLTDRLDQMIGRYRAWLRGRTAERTAIKLRLARGERAEIPCSVALDRAALRSIDGVVFPAENIRLEGGKLSVKVPAMMPAGIYRGRGIAIHVNDFNVPEETPPYVGPTADRGNVEASAKVLEATTAKIDTSKYPNWNWKPNADSVMKRVRVTGKKFGFTDDPIEYDFWRSVIAEVIDGNGKY